MKKKTKPVWIGTSWKMNKTLAEALSFVQVLKATKAPAGADIQRFVVAPFTSLRQISSVLAGSDVLVGAQNMHWEDAGAWTGEISAPMLVDCETDLVEIGHSERRAHFGETDETVGLKVAAAVRNGLLPLICVGETRQERQAGRAAEVIAQQVRAALVHVTAPVDVVFAYEPVWAIGSSGKPAAAEYVNDRHAHIKDVASGLTGSVPVVIYGGSVTGGNCQMYVTMPHVDGLFIGRSAWSVNGFIGILDRCGQALAELEAEL